MRESVLVTPEVYIIAIENNVTSQYYLNRVKPSWEKGGFKVNEFKACTPDTLNKEYCGLHLNFGKRDQAGIKRRGEEITLTEKAVWYSHLSLWNKCRKDNKNIIIVEHDALLIHPMKLSYFNNCKPIVAFATAGVPACAKYCECTDCIRTKKSRNITAGGAYYLTPKIARILINEAVSNIITRNSDGLIHTIMRKYGQVKGDHYRSYQLVSTKYRATIDHGDNFLGAVNKEYILDRVLKNADI